jgi:prepilin-type N-terminal cleavage/methylation domain-containing protein
MIKNLSRERGLTLVELVIAAAVIGLISGFLGTIIYQMLNITEDGNERLLAIHELQNAAHWVSIDGQGATSATGGSSLVLTLADNSTITYSQSGTGLFRNSGGVMKLAGNIVSAGFSVSNRTIIMSLTSAPAGRNGVSENGTYRVYLRPAGGGQ